jgi:hypothetical protein
MIRSNGYLTAWGFYTIKTPGKSYRVLEKKQVQCALKASRLSGEIFKGFGISRVEIRGRFMFFLIHLEVFRLPITEFE